MTKEVVMFYLKTQSGQLLVTNKLSTVKVPVQEITEEEYNQELGQLAAQREQDSEEQAIIDLVEKGYTIYK